MQPLKFAVLIFLFSIGFYGCYPMPTEEDYSTIPTTNNPDVVGNRGDDSFLPQGLR